MPELEGGRGVEVRDQFTPKGWHFLRLLEQPEVFDSGFHKTGLECLCLLGKAKKTSDSKLLPACFFPKFREGTFLSPMLKYWPGIAAYPKAQWEITILRLPLMAKDLRRIKWWTSRLIVTSLLIVVGKKAPFLGWFYSTVGAKIFSGVCGHKWSASPIASAFPVFSTTRCGTHLGSHTFTPCSSLCRKDWAKYLFFSIYNSTLLLSRTIFLQENKVLSLQRLALLCCVEGLHNKNSLIFKGDHTGVPRACFTFSVIQSLSP